MEEITLFEKRNGMQVSFNLEKITKAAFKAMDAAARKEDKTVEIEQAKDVSKYVLEQLNDPLSEFYVEEDKTGKRIPKLEDIQNLVEEGLSEKGHRTALKAFKRYRKGRTNSRKSLKIRTKLNGEGQDSTDKLLLVESASGKITYPWSKDKIAQQLVREAGLNNELALDVAKAVENKVMAGGYNTINTTLIREMANNELADRGKDEELKDLKMFSIAKSTLESFIFSKSNENSNIKNNNPEMVTQSMGEVILKQWALENVYGKILERAHARGRIHIHDLGFPTRVYCSSHSIEYIKKYGLVELANLSTESKPAKTAQVLTGHLNTFLASMQAYYAGALGMAYLNIAYAPLLEGATDKELEQRAQELIFNGSQNAFSRGGQTIFLDFNIHSGIPKYMKKVPAIGPGGKYMLKTKDGQIIKLDEVIQKEKSKSGNPLMELWTNKDTGIPVLKEIVKGNNVVYDSKIQKEVEDAGCKILTYGDYEEISRKFATAMLNVWEKGDKNGKVFEFPKCDFHVSEESFNDPEQNKVLQRACEVASNNGSTYFIFDRDQVTLSACCRLRTTIDDNHMLLHPESMRFCGFQNVTINIPQAAYIAGSKNEKTIDGLLKEIYKSMDLAMDAHLRKKESITEMLKKGRPLWQIGKTSLDGKPYVDLEKSTYIIGLIGVNDAIKYILGKEMHESEEAMNAALEIVSEMNIKTQEYSQKYNLKVTLEETPAESAARRLALQDLEYFKEEAKDIVKGNLESNDIYYTNSVHLAAEAPTGIVERIKKQAQFHSLIESGAITHAFVGEERPSSGSIYQLVKNTFYKTQSAQLTISPEFTYCNDCYHQDKGILNNCPKCDSENVQGVTRVVGYFSPVKHWNKSKQGELKKRQKGNYALGSSPAPEMDKQLELAKAEVV